MDCYTEVVEGVEDNDLVEVCAACGAVSDSSGGAECPACTNTGADIVSSGAVDAHGVGIERSVNATDVDVNALGGGEVSDAPTWNRPPTARLASTETLSDEQSPDASQSPSSVGGGDSLALGPGACALVKDPIYEHALNSIPRALTEIPCPQAYPVSPCARNLQEYGTPFLACSDATELNLSSLHSRCTQTDSRVPVSSVRSLGLPPAQKENSVVQTTTVEVDAMPATRVPSPAQTSAFFYIPILGRDSVQQCGVVQCAPDAIDSAADDTAIETLSSSCDSLNAGRKTVASKSCQTDREYSAKEVQTDLSQCQKECQTDYPDVPKCVVPQVTRDRRTKLCRGLSGDECERSSGPSELRGAAVRCHQRSCSTDYCLQRYSHKDSRQRRQQSSDFLYFVKKDPVLAANIPLNLHLDDDIELALHDRSKRRHFSAVEVVVLGASSGQEPPMVVPSSPPDERPPPTRGCSFSSGIGEASLYHALVVIFLEFFAWGLLTSPMIDVLNVTFPNHTFLMNGLIVGIKGILSFLSAPLIGALSDVWGRKFFLLVTVFFTCLPIPFMKINTWWYFALISMSGVFAVTFSIVFAYVADVTDQEERSYAYGLVSATFAASLVTSPALGAYLGSVHSDDLVVGLATAIAVLDVFFILVAVPESLPEKLRLSSSWSAANISWENADPFSALWKVSSDRKILLISMTVLLSYLPEAGQYSCFFVYLRLVMGFNAEMVATFIAAVGILSVVAQTAVLALLMRNLSCKRVIIVGLVFEMLQLMWYGFGSQTWMMWAAGLLAAMSSITYPAISAYVSMHTDVDKQGVVQGIVTGVRGLCSGLGPAMFGFIFYIFHVDLSETPSQRRNSAPAVGSNNVSSVVREMSVGPNLVPGPPFVFGALMVITALLVAAFIPEGSGSTAALAAKARRQSGGSSLDLSYERGHKGSGLDAASLPLMDESGAL